MEKDFEINIFLIIFLSAIPQRSRNLNQQEINQLLIKRREEI